MAEQYIERAHKEILIESWSNSAREILLRGHATEGPFAETHTTNADRSRAESTYQIHGEIQSLTVSPATTPVRRGECYVRVSLMLDGEPVQRLTAAYLTDSKTLSWPPGVHEGFTEGPGLKRIVVGTNPAAGAEITEAAPTNAVWKLLALWIQLICDATVINRNVIVIIDDATNTLLALAPDLAQTASQSIEYNMAPHLADRDTAIISRLTTPLPIIDLPQAYRFRTGTAFIQAGDNYAAPIFEVEEWIQE